MMGNFKSYVPALGLGLLLSASLAWAADAPKAPEAPPAAAPTAAAPASATYTPTAGGQIMKKWPAAIFDASPAEKAAMDINPDLYADFWKKWHFVAVRWREDTREIRLTYANDLAWKVLAEQGSEYPTGAMFGKLVYPA